MNKEPWDLRETVAKSVLFASRCWDKIPQGEFDAICAREIVDQLCDKIEERYRDHDIQDVMIKSLQQQVEDLERSLEELESGRRLPRWKMEEK